MSISLFLYPFLPCCPLHKFFSTIFLDFIYIYIQFSSVQSLSRVRFFQPHELQHAMNLPKLTSIESVMSSNHLILCRPLPLPPSIFPSIRVFSNESALCISWPKDWSFSFSISASSEYSGFLSFRLDWFDLLRVQGTLKSLLQQYDSKASILWRSAFCGPTLTSIGAHWKTHSFD